jgi:hypothetical protein
VPADPEASSEATFSTVVVERLKEDSAGVGILGILAIYTWSVFDYPALFGNDLAWLRGPVDAYRWTVAGWLVMVLVLDGIAWEATSEPVATALRLPGQATRWVLGRAALLFGVFLLAVVGGYGASLVGS